MDFDKTKNLFIEGENPDALKLLQETYPGKVTLTYIDSPYNRGDDFIYKDDGQAMSSSKRGANGKVVEMVLNPLGASA